ncbi:MAG: hypothetical protein DWQ19_11945 [Crenarchaeota archaeon]|nr:MAG: hypothetical protein DWQ19_11945 [Thermoproteota archaeon]
MRRKKKKLNKLQRQHERKIALEKKLHGEGLYLYKNNTSGTLILPKPLPNGKTRVEANAEFEGDNYFMQLVKNNSVRLIRELVSPKKEERQTMNENIINEEKLILDQPSTVTEKGVVEHVSVDPKDEKKEENLQEGKPQENQNEVLLNDDPLDGVTILG